MSLILEALKKSEAERQLGRAPGLMSPTVRVSKPRGPSPWWGVLALAVAIAGGAAWWAMRSPDALDAIAPVATDEATPPPVDPPRAATTPAPVAVQTPQPPPPASTPSAVPAAAPLPSDPEFASVERESIAIAAPIAPAAQVEVAPVAASAPPVAPPPAPPAPTPVPAAPTLPAETLLPAPIIDATAAATVLPAESPPPAPAPATLPTVDTTPAPGIEPVPTEPPLEALPTVSELMPDVRGALPALKLTMHVFSADPAGRFVLIDGKRLVQGDRLSASLGVAEIRRDGAVLDFGGKRFLVPRP